MNAANRLKIVWIDNATGHREDAKTIEMKRKELEIAFISPLDFEDFLKKEADADLFLIDDRLMMKGKTKSTSFSRRGLSVAAQIREKFPEIPIYLFSVWTEDFGIHTALAEAAESLADEILEYKTIQRKGHDLLYFDSQNYRKIRNSRRGSIDDLFRLLNAPEVDHERIKSALPEDLKTGLSPPSEKTRSAGNAIAFAKWIKRVFLRLPGFVYNTIYSATILGMTKDCFLGHSSEFKDAQYTGIFADTWENNLWWGSKLRDIVFNRAKTKLPDAETTDPQKVVEKLYGLREREVAKCVVCNEPYPETVGINKDDDTDYRPVHYRHSITHPTKPQVLFFDEVRQFKLE